MSGVILLGGLKRKMLGFIGVWDYNFSRGG